jgi:hypothetical protein
VNSLLAGDAIGLLVQFTSESGIEGEQEFGIHGFEMAKSAGWNQRSTRSADDLEFADINSM